MYSLNVLGKSRIEYLLFDDICALNLNALINKFTFNPILLTAALDELGKSYPIINLCGFAMLCYRLNIPYGSSRSVALAQNIKNFFTKYYPNFSFCQKEIEFDGAVEDEDAAEDVEESGGLDGDGEEMLDDEDDEDGAHSTTSITAMETALFDPVLEILNKISSYYDELSRIQNQRMKAILAGRKAQTSLEKKYLNIKKELVELMSAIHLNSARVEELVEQLNELNLSIYTPLITKEKYIIFDLLTLPSEELFKKVYPFLKSVWVFNPPLQKKSIFSVIFFSQHKKRVKKVC